MLNFFKDRIFLREMLIIAFPISLQQFINAALNMIDVVMVGQLGETSIAAVGLANQIFFVMILLLFGTTSGMAIFTAQYWGKGEIEPIRKVLGMSVVVTSTIALLFTIGAIFYPKVLLSLYTKDPAVIEIGAQYLRIVGLSYIPVAIATAYSAVLRSIQLVRIAVIASALALIFKTILGYILIFGHFGFPALGVQGAAIGTASGWTLELILLFILIYTQKTPLATTLSEMMSFDLSFFARVLKTTTPAIANELFWSTGITTYNAIYARIGTDSIAAVQVNMTIEELAFVIFIGLGNACGVMVGNRIGAKQNEEAYEIVKRSAVMSVMFALIVGFVILLSINSVVSLYELSESGRYNVRMLMTVMACALWIRMFNFVTFVGAMRAGGDTRFALFMEVISIWGIGVPAAYIGAFVLGLPVYYVYLMVMIEELVKAFVSMWRIRSKKWIHDLVNV